MNALLNIGNMSTLDYDLKKNLGDSVVDINGYTIYQSPTGIKYKLNKDLFRSIHFDEFDKNKNNMLFSGCSSTFGIGLPDECLWSSMVLKEINADESFNSSFFGHSIDIIIKNIMSFISKFGSPKIILICFPETSRIVKNDNGLYKVLNPNTNKYPEDSYKSRKKYYKNYDYKENLYYFSSLIHMLELFCKQANIKLLWTSWSINDLNLFKDINFSNFVMPDQKSNYYKLINSPDFKFTQGQEECGRIENVDSLPYWKLSATKDHPGSCWNKSLSEIFIERLKSEVL